MCESGDRDLPGEGLGWRYACKESRPGCLHGGGMLGLGKGIGGISMLIIVIVLIT